MIHFITHRFTLKKTTFTNWVSLFIITIYLCNYSLHWSSKNLGIYCYLLSLIMGVRSPRLGFYALICLLPWTGSLPEQIRHFFNVPLQPIYHVGLDFTAGWISGCFINRYRAKVKLSFDKLVTQRIVRLFCFYLMLTCIMGIFRNFWQSATIPTLKGFIYHLSSWRTLSWHDDLYPWKEFIYFITAIGALNSAFHLKDKVNVEKLANCFAWTTVFLCIFALLQWSLQIGWNRDPFSRGVNSFFQDLHAFAGYLLASFTFLSICIRQCIHSRTKALYTMAMTLNILALFASGSRASVIFLMLYVTAYAIYFACKSRKKIYLVLIILSSIPTMTGTGYYLAHKGITFEKVQNVISNPDFRSINKVLSYRPEIFKAAVDMISDYPVLGLGLGGFNRTSAIKGYSSSTFLIKKHGENAHNYFLQVAVDTGILGLLLFLFILLYPAKYLTHHQRTTYLALMGGIALGNLYSHSLLEREFLILTFLCAGYFYRPAKYYSDTPPSTHWEKLFKWKYAIVVASIFMFLFARSTVHLPFTYGLKCYDQKNIFQDKWISGLFIQSIPAGTQKVVIQFRSGDQTATIIPIEVTLFVKNNSQLTGEEIIETKLLVLDSQETQITELLIPPSSSQENLTFNITAGRCFVPRNNGRTNDQRHLSLQIIKLDFL